MNSKLVKASVAGVAAIALTAGGSTFASWSDFYVLDDNNVGADVLALNVNETINAQTFNNLKLAPGVGNDFEFVVASRVGDTVPLASLRMALTDLVDSGDVKDSNSEDQAEGGLPLDGAVTPAGEFDEEARIIVNASSIIPNIAGVANPCDSALYPRGARQTSISIRDLATNTATTPLNVLPTGLQLAAGEGVCVSLGINLPSGATNASQGDSASFNLRFLLDQIV